MIKPALLLAAASLAFAQPAWAAPTKPAPSPAGAAAQLAQREEQTPVQLAQASRIVVVYLHRQSARPARRQPQRRTHRQLSHLAGYLGQLRVDEIDPVERLLAEEAERHVQHVGVEHAQRVAGAGPTAG